MKRLKIYFLSILLFISIVTTVYTFNFEGMLQHPEEHWYNVAMDGSKIGYMHISLEKTEYQGEPMILSKTKIMTQVKGIRAKMKNEVTLVEYIDSNFTPRYFSSTTNQGESKQVEGEVLNGVAHIKTILNGETTESRVVFPPDTVSEHMAIYSFLAGNNVKIGIKRNFHTFVFELFQPAKSEIRIMGEEILTYQSEEKHVYILQEKVDIVGGINLRHWVSPDGTIYRSESKDRAGVSIMVTKTDKKTALGDVEEVDIILKSRILPTGKKLRPKASRLIANVQVKKGKIDQTIMTNSRQKLENVSDMRGKLTINVPKVNAKNSPNLPIKHPELKPFLSATAYVQADHPTIRAKALEILDGETNSWRAAKKLYQWVYKSTRKKINNGFATSLTTLESLTGDCTELSVLLTALARSVGIPARICSGLAFSGNAFYYHFWPEVYVGTWIPMEPTLGQMIADANHIQLAGSNLESDTLIELTEGVSNTLNQLKIDILESSSQKPLK